MVHDTLEKAAKTLHVSENEILELTALHRLWIGTVISNGTTLFLRADDIHSLMADSKTPIKTSDLKLTYNEYPDPDSPSMPTPNVLLVPPVSDVTLKTLRIPRKEVARLKKILGLKHRLRTMVREGFITKVVSISGGIKSLIDLINKIRQLF
jgi:hypothetical protein